MIFNSLSVSSSKLYFSDTQYSPFPIDDFLLCHLDSLDIDIPKIINNGINYNNESLQMIGKKRFYGDESKNWMII